MSMWLSNSSEHALTTFFAGDLHCPSKKKKILPFHSSKSKKRGNKKDALLDEENKRLSTMAEEDDEDEGITIKVGGAEPPKAPQALALAPSGVSGTPAGAKDMVLVTEPGPGGPAAPV